MVEKLLEPGEVADALGVSEKTLQNWRSDGRGPHYVRAGRLIKYRERDVQLWVQTRSSDPAAAREMA